MAGTEQPPADWTNKRLGDLGERWRVSTTLSTETMSAEEAFAVAVETKIMVPTPSKDVAGTGYWALNWSGANCFLRSADVVMFIRIKNLQKVKTMITAYNVYGLGGELNRIKTNLNKPFYILKRGQIPPNLQRSPSFQMPAPSGNAGGRLSQIQFEDTDFSVAAPVQADLLDNQIGEHYIQPADTVRGWAFFEYPRPGAFPVRLTVKINDDLGHAFSYRIPDEPGNPSGDTLQRLLSYGPAVNLSSCVRLPHPVVSQ